VGPAVVSSGTHSLNHTDHDCDSVHCNNTLTVSTVNVIVNS
jgi:hypothetical protein